MEGSFLAEGALNGQCNLQSGAPELRQKSGNDVDAQKDQWEGSPSPLQNRLNTSKHTESQESWPDSGGSTVKNAVTEEGFPGKGSPERYSREWKPLAAKRHRGKRKMESKI